MPTDDLLDDPSSYIEDDGWHVLRHGEEAGTLHLGTHSQLFRGGDLFSVDLVEPYDEDSGVDAPPGTTGQLVAISEKLGYAAVKTAAGKTYLADMSDLRVTAKP